MAQDETHSTVRRGVPCWRHAIVLVFAFTMGCSSNIPKSDICGTDDGWSTLRSGKRYPIEFSKAIMRDCNLNQCKHPHYNAECRPLIELSRMTLAPEDGSLDQKLQIHIEQQSSVLAKLVARRWRTAIEQDLFLTKYVGFLTTPATSYWENPAREELADIQEGIQALPDGEFREIFIELYVVAEQYDALAYDQTGYSLVTYEKKIDELDSEAASLLSRLKFAR